MSAPTAAGNRRNFPLGLRRPVSSAVGSNPYVDLEAGFPASVDDAAGRRHVPIVPARRETQMSGAGQTAVGGVESDPAELRQTALDPGVGRVVRHVVAGSSGYVQITGDVARRDPPGACNRDHRVGEVLADASIRAEDLVHGGLRRRRSRDVVQTAVERFRELHQAFERVASGVDAMPLDERGESGGGGDQRAWVNEVPILEGRSESVDLLPGRRAQASRQHRRGCRLDRRAGGDFQNPVRVVDVEHVPDVAEAVPFAAQAAGRTRLDSKVKQPLPPVPARLQAKQHRAPAHAARVVVAGHVLDCVADDAGHVVQRIGASLMS